MQFPFAGGSSAVNSSDSQGESLFARNPVVAAPYVGVLGVAAVVGTLGNLVIIATVTIKRVLPFSRSQRTRTTGNDVGQTFIVNLALSDLIVTSVINPLAIAGLCSRLSLGYIVLFTTDGTI